MKREYLLRQRLVTGENESRRTRAGIPQIEQIEQRRDVGFQRALSAKGFSKIENEIGLKIPQRGDHRLDRVVGRQPPRRVTILRQRGVELIEKGIEGRIERVFAVQDGDLHESLVDSVGMAVVHHHRRAESGQLDERRRFQSAESQVQLPDAVRQEIDELPHD